MSWCRCLLAAVLVLACTMPAPAQLFGKKKQVNPQQRVPELLGAAQAEPDERKRTAAVDELRQYNAQEFPEIVLVLVEVLKKDTSSTVRLEAASTLAKVRPTTKTARDALEQAASGDGNWRVRLNARSSLMFYHVSNDAAAKKGPLLAPQSTEPPLAVPAQPQAQPWKAGSSPTPTPMPAPIPVNYPKMPNDPNRLRPVPAPNQTSAPPLQPTPAPVLVPTPAGSEEGPLLTPPQ